MKYNQGKNPNSRNGFKKGNKIGLGRKHTEESKRKMSMASMGKPKSEITKRRMSKAKLKNPSRYWLGKKRPDIGKIMSKLSPKRIGKNSGNWKGGITPEHQKIRKSIEYQLWREAVFARDNWTCQKYKIKGGKLIAHHVQNFAHFPELRFAIDNGITLSEKAHHEFHKRYGTRNTNYQQLTEFLTL